MELQSILSFLVITEKFKLDGLIAPEDRSRLDTIDQLRPIYKKLEGAEFYISDKYADIKENVLVQKYPELRDYDKRNPIYRTYFDFTDGELRKSIRVDMEGNITNVYREQNMLKDPIEVQIRIQFTEPNQDTLGVNRHRRFLRTGQLQFLVIAKFEQDKDGQVLQDRRALFEAFVIAQNYANRYEGTDGPKILMALDDTTKAELMLDNPTMNQFSELTQEEYINIMSYLFPGQGTPYERIVQEVKTLNTGIARIVNLRFAELERRTVDPIRITNPTYGLAVTVPFTFEQIR